MLAQHFGRSAQTLNREFKERFGLPIAAYVSAQRLQEAHAAIANTATPLKVIAANLGYSHVNHFSNAFRRQFGYSPGALRKGSLKGTDDSE
ncbi:helix-turn-helix domain-containing protein [Allochromatium palmeri]|uniref:helix-turn-helix domain-containing protein n=1 Tax=Allochromatium palmeri TaxID=231048 RepID=UPI0016430C44